MRLNEVFSDELPMDQKSRYERARRMGFDTSIVYYHGTSSDFTKFDPKGGNGAGSSVSRLGTWLTTDPDVAEKFSHFSVPFKDGKPNTKNNKYQSGPHIMPLFIRMKNPKIYTQQGDVDAYDMMRRDRGKYVDYFVKDPDPQRQLIYAERNSTEANRKFIAELTSHGHDGILIRRTTYDANNGVTDQIIIFDPKNVKSIHAKFEKDSEHILEGVSSLPTIKISQAYHVGSMNRADKRTNSYEGAGLSISFHPNAWRQIARGFVTGDTWLLSKPAGTFVSIHDLTPEHRQSIMRWGVDNGLIELVPKWLVQHWDEDGELMGYMEFDSEEEARNELDDSEDLGTYPQIKMITDGIRGLPKFRELSGGFPADFDILVTVYVEQTTTFDGVWWEDAYNPNGLSAPRGVILPSRLASWSIQRVDDAEEEDDMMLETAAYPYPTSANIHWGSTNPTDYTWEFMPDYPIAKFFDPANPYTINDTAQEWMEYLYSEIDEKENDGTEEAAERIDSWMSVIRNGVNVPICVIMMNGWPTLFDGQHRVGASIVARRRTIPAVVGTPKKP